MSQNNNIRQQLIEVYRLLLHRYGPQYWWPADSPFEVIVGAILTQSTSWINVEKAILNLKSAGVLHPDSLRRLSHSELAELIHPCGYYNSKAQKLKAFVEYLANAHHDSLNSLFSPDIPDLRKELIAIHGIGEETADSIILYAARKPLFVVDAYTRRIITRTGLNSTENSYSAYQELFMNNLPHKEKLFNEYHALFVRHGKETCKKNPSCNQCCLKGRCAWPQASVSSLR